VIDRAPLLIEIGCEEIPARMVARAAADLAERVVRALDQAGLGHAAATHWADRGDWRPCRGRRRWPGGPRGAGARPPATAAFNAAGLTPAAIGFARKQGVEPDRLTRVVTPRGEYVGFVRPVAGAT